MLRCGSGLTTKAETRVDEGDVLLRELSHRAGNDLAIALAAVRLAGRGTPADPTERSRLLDRAGSRLEASAELHRVLARPMEDDTDVGAWLRATCIAATAPVGRSGQVHLDVPELWLDGTTARRMVLIASELVANAIKYAVDAGAELWISLRDGRSSVLLKVADDGPGFVDGDPARGTGLGSGIVADLVAIGGGRIDVSTGRGGTSIEVEMPKLDTDAAMALA